MGKYEAEALELKLKCPHPGTRWRHRKTGGVYDVVCGVLLEATLEPHVVYARVGGDYQAWCRPLAQFLDGRFERVTREG